MQVIFFRFVVKLSELHERVESQIWRNVSRCQTAIAPLKNGPKETESSLCPLSKHVPRRRARTRETEFKLNLCKQIQVQGEDDPKKAVNDCRRDRCKTRFASSILTEA